MATCWPAPWPYRKELVDAVRLQGLRYYTGATLSPFTAFLVLRGLKTLELRVQRHSESALRVARLLREHPAVADVFYPGLADTGRRRDRAPPAIGRRRAGGL
ncbi:PLP-dependent transferase [Achromobacter xylosoxidans]